MKKLTFPLKPLCLFLLLFSHLYSPAQSQAAGPDNPPSEALYGVALDSVMAMLDGRRPPSFKRAVYLSENAFLDGRLRWESFDGEIRRLAGLARLLRSSRRLLYDGADSVNVQRNAAIFSVMCDSVPLLAGSDTLWHLPMGYDPVDFNGREDWSRMFVSKLLETGKGNCHSLPYLYKILADETGAGAWLSVTPNHAYVKARSKRDGWYNTELTSGYFPHDAWIMASGYVYLDAIRSGLYMDTLGGRESLAAVLVDLALGHERKFGLRDGRFVLRACSLALQTDPTSVNAMLLQAETQRRLLFARHGLPGRVAAGAPDTVGTASLQTDTAFAALTALYARVHRLGYRRMPDPMYMDWLWELKQRFPGFDPDSLIAYRPPPSYKWDTPFHKEEVLTLSKGKYIEEFDRDSLERIGAALYNWQTGQIVCFVLGDTIPARYRLEPEITGRWLSPDPLMAEFPSWSPYVYVNDNPVMLVDPDGRMARLPGGTGDPTAFGPPDGIGEFGQQPLTNTRFENYLRSTGLGGSGFAFNKAKGAVFEQLFLQNAVIGGVPNFRTFSPGAGTPGVRPDGVGITMGRTWSIDPRMPGKTRFYPQGSFFEVKGTKNPVGLTAQIRGQIDVLANQRSGGVYATDQGAATLVIVTFSGNHVKQTVIEHAASRNVNLYHVTATYDPDEGTFMFSAPNPLFEKVVDHNGVQLNPAKPHAWKGDKSRINWNTLPLWIGRTNEDGSDN